MATLRRRIGLGIVTALKAGDTLIDTLLGGAGSTLNVGLGEDLGDPVVDEGLGPGHCLVSPLPGERLAFAEGETRHNKQRVYNWRLRFWLDYDVGTTDTDTPGTSIMQALERIFADPRVFFNTHLTDTEGNLASKSGRVELDEDFRETNTTKGIIVDCRLSITVTHKAALTE
jgi:hypothetical protein